MKKFVSGDAVCLDEKKKGHLFTGKLHLGEVYRIEEVRIIPKRNMLPDAYIKSGCIPDQYKPHMIKGLRTTNHDLMGSDRFVQIKGEEFAASWFRYATATEVNQKAKSLL